MFATTSRTTWRRRRYGPSLASPGSGKGRRRTFSLDRDDDVTELANEGGFTLVELLVAMVAALVVFGATLTLLVPSQRVQARASEWALVLQQDRVGLTRMVQDIRQASKLEETTASATVFLATIAGKPWKIKYQCNVSQSGTTYTQCERLAAEVPAALPSTGQAVTTYMVNGTSVFSYSPAAKPTVTTIKIELPSTGKLVQPGGEGHKIVLEDAAFMRYQYLEG
jgi:prepilin-type N-terminal cleavage/methylation domain-containing protein